MFPNVGESERLRIRDFAENTDMKKYVRDFLSTHMPDAQQTKRYIPRTKPVVEELPKVTVQRPQHPNTTPILTIQNISLRSHLLNEFDPSDKISLDINIAGHRFRTSEFEASSNVVFLDTFTLSLHEPTQIIINKGCGSVVAILRSGPNQEIIGSGNFEWREKLCGKTVKDGFTQKKTVSLYHSLPHQCATVDLMISVNPPVCKADEVKAVIDKETTQGSQICELSSRIVPTPFHAFRLAGLLNNIYRDKPEDDDQFSPCFSIHNTLASRNGTGPDICAVLCSFFCGFGIESYVCGRTVVTIHEKYATVWDPFKGNRQNVEKLPTSMLFGYQCKLEPKIEDPPFQTNDPRFWKRTELPPPVSSPSVLPCDQINEDDVENDIKRMITAKRRNLVTKFNAQISSAMRPLLQTYELSKLNQSSDTWTSNVNDSVRYLMPKKSTIKVYPSCIHYTDNSSLFARLLEKASDILLSPEASELTFSLAMFPYAENLYSCWCLLGAILPSKSK